MAGNWLWATPVTVLCVANLTGRNETYTKLHAWMIIADVFAVTFFLFNGASFNFWIKLFASIASLGNFCFLFYVAFKCFQDTERAVPTNRLRRTIKMIVAIFYIGWNLHTFFSAAGPECLKFLNPLQTQIGSVFADLTCKMLFSAAVTYFRVQMQKDWPLENAGKKPVAKKAADDDDDDDMEDYQSVKSVPVKAAKSRAANARDDDTMSHMSYNPNAGMMGGGAAAGMMMSGASGYGAGPTPSMMMGGGGSYGAPPMIQMSPSVMAGSPQRANPLYGSSASPFNSRPGNAGSGVPLMNTQQQMQMQQMAVPAGAAPAQEAEVLQQLMTEINRLKSELQN